MNLDWSTIALQTINFAILVWLLQHFLYKPVLRMIDARKAELQRQFDHANAAEEKARAHLAAAEAERANIAAEREAALKAVAAQAEEAAKARRTQAESEAAALLEKTRKSLSKERQHALAEARDTALDLGAEFARRLLSEVPTQFRIEQWIDPFRAEAWIERIEQHLSALPRTELNALVRQLAEGSSLTVITSTPLSPAMAEAWRARLHRSLGDGTTIVFEVNPDLIAGAELHFPSAVLQFSWQSALAAVRSEIGAHGDAQ